MDNPPPIEDANRHAHNETRPDKDTISAEPPIPSAPPRQPKRLIALTIPEIRHLLHRADQGRRAITSALKWSLWRRVHQADARRRHYRRRLRTQALAL